MRDPNYFVKPSATSFREISGPVVVVHVEGGEGQAVVAVQRVAGVAVVQILATQKLHTYCDKAHKMHILIKHTKYIKYAYLL
jgi:hypothetical protein